MYRSFSSDMSLEVLSLLPEESSGCRPDHYAHIVPPPHSTPPTTHNLRLSRRLGEVSLKVELGVIGIRDNYSKTASAKSVLEPPDQLYVPSPLESLLDGFVRLTYSSFVFSINFCLCEYSWSISESLAEAVMAAWWEMP